MLDREAFSAIYRSEAGRCVATLVRVLGDVDLAEDAVAEAFTIAAERWAQTGIPPNPGGWITTTARNRAIDRHRREAKRADRHAAAQRLTEPASEPETERHLGNLDIVPDDQLRLVFLCCHPSLGQDVQVAMTLRLLGGLDTGEIARAFLVPESTMAQRLVRAKRKIRDNNLTYRIPTPAELADRLPPTLAVIYLIFAEGHSTRTGPSLVRTDLTGEAIRLGRVLVELMPDEPEAAGLLALMLLTDARRTARTGPCGDLVRLADQDRRRWDRDMITEGHRIVRACLRRNQPGPYQIQAAIAAVHADAATAEATDWGQIVALYDQLYARQPTDIVRLNRAIAVAEQQGPRFGLEALSTVGLDTYHLYHATRGDFLARLGHHDAAADAFDQALMLTTNDAERRYLTHRRNNARRDQPGHPHAD